MSEDLAMRDASPVSDSEEEQLRTAAQQAQARYEAAKAEKARKAQQEQEEEQTSLRSAQLKADRAVEIEKLSGRLHADRAPEVVANATVVALKSIDHLADNLDKLATRHTAMADVLLTNVSEIKATVTGMANEPLADRAPRLSDVDKDGEGDSLMLKHVKVKPPAFTGKPEKGSYTCDPRNFLHRAEEYALLYKLTESQQVQAAALWLQGSAYEAWRLHCKTLDDAERESWTAFTQFMLKQYGAYNIEREAVQSLLKIEQKPRESVHEYALRFKAHMNQKEHDDWPDSLHAILFYNGLNSQLKQDTAVDPVSKQPYNALQPLIDAAVGHASSKDRGAPSENDGASKRSNKFDNAAVQQAKTGDKRHRNGAKASAGASKPPKSNAFDASKVSDKAKTFCFANHLCMRCGEKVTDTHTAATCTRPFHRWAHDTRVYNSARYVPPHMTASSDWHACVEEEDFDSLMHTNMDAKLFHEVRKSIGTQVTCDVGCHHQCESLAYDGKYCKLADFPGMAVHPGDVMWLHAPPSQLHHVLQTYLHKKASQPDVAAMMIVPASQGPWRPLLHGFKLVKQYDAGTVLMRGHVDQNNYWQPPAHEPMQIWWDKPNNSATLPTPMLTLNAMSYGAEHMKCCGLVAGHKCKGILLDTGADTCFMSSTFANQLWLKPNTADDQAN